MPLENIHKQAFAAAEATHCAEEQGQFWEMYERLFANQRAIEPVAGHAEALGLDVEAFEACMESDRHAEAIRQDMKVARSAGATGTPSFVVAKTDPDNPAKVTGITFIRGAQSYDRFKSALDEALDGDTTGE